MLHLWLILLINYLSEVFISVSLPTTTTKTKLFSLFVEECEQYLQTIHSCTNKKAVNTANEKTKKLTKEKRSRLLILLADITAAGSF